MIALTTSPTKPASAIAPRPLMGIGAVCWRLDLGEDDVLGMIECGRLAYAWNIAADSTRAREMRVLTESVSEFILGNVRQPDDSPAEWSRVLSMVLPERPVIFGTELSRSLNCSSTHIMNLVTRRAIQTVPGTRWGTGPSGSPQIERASIESFLKQRRVV
jgi:hypothetical protein